MPPAPSDQEFTLPQVNVRIGQLVQLVGKEPPYRKYFTQIHGFIENECVIVQVPTAGGSAISIIHGEWFQFRLFSGLSLCEFECRLIKLLRQPRGVMLMSYPENVTRTTVRNHERVKLRLPVEVSGSNRAKGMVKECEFRDLSGKGAALVSPVLLGDVGQSIKVHVTFTLKSTGTQEKTNMEAVIRKVEQLQEDGLKWVHGIEFRDFDQKLLLLVDESRWRGHL